MEAEIRDESVPREIQALFSNQRVVLRETSRAVTPFGGVAVFVAFLSEAELRRQGLVSME